MADITVNPALPLYRQTYMHRHTHTHVYKMAGITVNTALPLCPVQVWSVRVLQTGQLHGLEAGPCAVPPDPTPQPHLLLPALPARTHLRRGYALKTLPGPLQIHWGGFDYGGPDGRYTISLSLLPLVEDSAATLDAMAAQTLPPPIRKILKLKCPRS